MHRAMLMWHAWKVKNFHLPLPDDTYEHLRAAAERSNVPATAIAREAIDVWLGQQLRKARHDAIAAYAAETAGTDLDLDAKLEFSGRGIIRSLDGSAISIGWGDRRDTWSLGISPGVEPATLSCGSSEHDPLGSTVVEIRFGSTICIMEGRTPADSLMPDL